MARYDVRFQLQVGSKNVNSIPYHSENEPCTKKEALQKLATLWAKEMEYFGDSEWNRNFKGAIEKAEAAVNRAQNASAAANRNFYSTTFFHKGVEYRVDIAIEAGEGHFND